MRRAPGPRRVSGRWRAVRVLVATLAMHWMHE